MRIPRVFHPGPLQEGTQVNLSKSASHHLIDVLRLKPENPIVVFNGDGKDYVGYLSVVSKQAIVFITQANINKQESPLNLHLGQVVSRGEKMDFTIQKAVELGVTMITPIISARCNVRLNDERQEKKIHHWQSIMTAACEQSGRSIVPLCQPITPLSQFLANEKSIFAKLNLMLDPSAEQGFASFQDANITHVKVLIGSEGGFTETEIMMAKEAGFIPITLGPRILRTETAGLTILSILQYRWGDLS